MNIIFRLLVSIALLLPTSLLAETITTSIGTLTVPDGLAVLDRSEKPDAKSGKPSGIIVFSKANDAPRAVFIITWVYVEPSDKPFDAQDAAVKIGNPFDKSLTSDNAKPAKVGGIEAARYEGILPNGLRAISYVSANGPYRMIVLLKAPTRSPYDELTNEFARSIENFAWSLPDTPANSASK